MILGFPALHPNFVMHFCLQRSMVSNPSLCFILLILGLHCAWSKSVLYSRGTES